MMMLVADLPLNLSNKNSFIKQKISTALKLSPCTTIQIYKLYKCIICTYLYLYHVLYFFLISLLSPYASQAKLGTSTNCKFYKCEVWFSFCSFMIVTIISIAKVTQMQICLQTFCMGKLTTWQCQGWCIILSTICHQAILLGVSYRDSTINTVQSCNLSVFYFMLILQQCLILP